MSTLRSVPPERARLLVLDDEDTVAQTLQVIAEAAGHHAAFTTNPAEFLDLLDSWRPTHVAIDLVMPDTDGLEVLAAMAERDCQCQIIISSGMGNEVLAAAQRFAAVQGLSIAGVLRKPYRASALTDLLEQPPPQPPTRPATWAAADPQPVPVTSTDLELALKRDQIHVVYQPKFACSPTGGLVGFEALARWTHPRRGPVSPTVFVPLAERYGLIGDLTTRVLDEAGSWLASLPSERLTLAINVSAVTIGQRGFAESLKKCCASHGVDAERVVLELTETVALEDDIDVLAQLTRLRLAGFCLSLDDYGTGHSTMAMLARLPFSEIKVDRSFVSSLASRRDAQAMVKSVIDLGQSLDLRTVAEGVEDEETWKLLCSLGADVAQGYFLGLPMSADEARALALGEADGIA
ncbi:MAG: EAL domain-containing response regulator [Actinomycetota bacterium]